MPLNVPRGPGPNWHAFYTTAAQQHGCFTTAQAMTCKISQPLVHYYVQTGWFERVERAVFRVAEMPSTYPPRLVAAWLRSGHVSVFSHMTAACMHDGLEIPSVIQVTLPLAYRKRRLTWTASVEVYFADLVRDEVETLAGLPITVLSRTLFDLSGKTVTHLQEQAP